MCGDIIGNQKQITFGYPHANAIRCDVYIKNEYRLVIIKLCQYLVLDNISSSVGQAWQVSHFDLASCAWWQLMQVAIAAIAVSSAITLDSLTLP